MYFPSDNLKGNGRGRGRGEEGMTKVRGGQEKRRGGRGNGGGLGV